MNISIKLQINGVDTELYPEHIFDWKLSGVNCATEDLSIGGVSDTVLTFTSDLKANVHDIALLDYHYYVISEVKHLGMTNRWQYTCIPGHWDIQNNYDMDGLDQIIPDATMEQWAEQTMTLNQLHQALQCVPSNNLPINGNYVINTNFGYTGLTKRQVLQWIYQLSGDNLVSRNLTDYAYPDSNSIFWYSNDNKLKLYLTPSNVKKIELADYTVPKIDKIWFGTDSSDVGLSYGTGKQQLSMPYNPLINPEDDSFLQPLYNRVHGMTSYTPMKIELFWESYQTDEEIEGGGTYSFDFSARSLSTIVGIILSCRLPFYTDENNNTYIGEIFSWELSPSGIVLECTGNPSREFSNSLISSEIAQNGKYNKFKRTLDATVSEVANLNGDVSTLNQTAATLTLQVAGKVGKDEVISSINQTAETITINANKINLVGAVTFSDLDSSTQSAINDKTDSTEVTQIIGNTVNAAYINALEINAKKIVATYTKTFNHSDYSSSDKVTVNQLKFSKDWTEADLDRYDIDMDGQITQSDVVAVREMIDNGVDKTATIKTEIDPSKVSRPIAIYVNGSTTPMTSISASRVNSGAAYIDNIDTSLLRSDSVQVNDTSNHKRVTITGSDVEFRDTSSGDTLIGKAPVLIDSGTTSTTTSYTSGSQSFSCWIDWDYRKWGDGTYECWGKANLYVASGQWANWGSVRSLQTLTPHLKYPVTFLSAPHEQVTACSSNDDWGFWISAGANTNCNNTTTTTARYQLVRGADGTINNYSSVPMRLEFYVVGKVSV